MKRIKMDQMVLSANYIDTFQDSRLINKSKNTYYYNIAAAFDIETTTIPCRKEKDEYVMLDKYCVGDLEKFRYEPTAFMYHWQFAMKCYDDELIVTGRTWDQFLQMIELLIERLCLNSNRRLVIYSHLLQHEFQYIQYFFSWDQIFAREPRAVIKAVSYEGLEFRCSYFLSNMSLKKFCENTEGVIHGKMVGDLDYRKFRLPSTKMTRKEDTYCINDVWGLVEGIWTLISGEDNIVTIPLTNTGYVRREVRKNCFNMLGYHKIINQGWPDIHVYELCRKAFRGGDTHANRLWANRVMFNVHSKDKKSSYPASIMYEDYPSGPARKVQILDEKDYYKYFDERKNLGVMRIELFDFHLKNNIAMPYIDLAHCEKKHIPFGLDDEENDYVDNGRLLGGLYIRYCCTNIDMEIIFEQYDIGGFKIIECYIWGKEKLPLPIRESTRDYFMSKTTLDGISEKLYEYLKSKNRLNSIFGMMVTAIDQDDIVYNEGEWYVKESDTEKQLERVKKSGNTFLLYQWGIFITAYARRALHEVLDEIGMDAVYIDTDSIKFIGEDNERFFEESNEKILKQMGESDVQPFAFTKDNEKMIMGVWEDEGVYDEFKTLGAKKYCYKKNDKYTVTVSGMNKEKGSKQIKSMDDFYIGKVYEDVGRTIAFYNDYKPQYIDIMGERVLLTPNVAIVDTTYTLGVTDTYWELIEKMIKELEKEENKRYNSNMRRTKKNEDCR